MYSILISWLLDTCLTLWWEVYFILMRTSMHISMDVPMNISIDTSMQTNLHMYVYIYMYILNILNIYIYIYIYIYIAYPWVGSIQRFDSKSDMSQSALPLAVILSHQAGVLLGVCGYLDRTPPCRSKEVAAIGTCKLGGVLLSIYFLNFTKTPPDLIHI